MSWFEREDGGPSRLVYVILVVSVLGGIGVVVYENSRSHPSLPKQTKPWLDRP